MKKYRKWTVSLLLTFIFISLLLPHQVNANTSSGERIEIYVYGPGIAQIIDVYGRRSGRDLVSGDILLEVPRSKVEKEGTKDRMPGWTIHIMDPAEGEYRIKLVATGAGAFAIDVDTVDSAGNLDNHHLFRRVKSGDSLTFHLTYRNDPGRKNTLAEIIVR